MNLIKSDIFRIILAFLFAASLALIFFIPNYWIIYFTIVFSIIAYLVVIFDLQVSFLKLFAFLLPFSIEVPFIGDARIFIPGEPLIAIAVFILIIDFFVNPNQLFRKFSREFVWLIPLLSAFILTVPFSQMIEVSIKFSFVNIVYILVFYIYLMRIFSSHPKIYVQLIIIYGLGFFLVTLWAIYQYWKWDWNPEVVGGIFQPFFKDHTVFSATAAILGGFWFASFFLDKLSISKLLSFLLWVFYIVWIILSSSRAGLLSIIFSFIVFIILWMKVRFKNLAILTLIIASVMIIYRNEISMQMQNIKKVSHDRNAGIIDKTLSSGNVTTDVSNIERLNRWISALRMFKEKKFTGFGPGSYQFTYIPYQDEAYKNRLTVTNPWDVPENSGGTAHSEYFLAMSEMGILGLLGWISLLGRWLYIVFKKDVNPYHRKNIVIAFVALSTYLFHGLFNNFLNTDKTAFLFWATAAWLTVNFNLSNEQRVLQAS